MESNILVLLRSAASGEKKVFINNTTGEYIHYQCKDTKWVENCEEKTVESRLQFELYGEYPLSEKNQMDWNRNTEPIFNRIIT